ncbi:hypothetical protein UMM65_14160 [Aureibaculum sp. 2210JD6-5]|uniref:hypothetical protein n=1 Tax=Aureibaculum sp. 2210JD6-5 TaxID=3103957 RepID=UPI002AAE6E7C|nr:hypothetical protein [Aureibaculum sp. 2210JD6-5]MDY7396391.1 hypothetical protein [Aureibaculum sp. 2210JD6-5]
MTFLEKIKSAFFWKRALMIIIPFFIVLVIISLLFNSFSAIIEADMATVMEQNFTQGKWKRFFLTKILVSVLYGVWITSRNVK